MPVASASVCLLALVREAVGVDRQRPERVVSFKAAAEYTQKRRENGQGWQTDEARGDQNGKTTVQREITNNSFLKIKTILNYNGLLN
jgi:hypothetical protein